MPDLHPTSLPSSGRVNVQFCSVLNFHRKIIFTRLSSVRTKTLLYKDKEGIVSHNNLRIKGKGHHITGHDGPEGEKRYNSISLTSALDRVGGQRHAPTALPPGKTQYPLYTRLGGPQDRSGRVRKISLPPGVDPRTVQPAASRYTD
jgi:hypothetical protein